MGCYLMSLLDMGGENANKKYPGPGATDFFVKIVGRATGATEIFGKI